MRSPSAAQLFSNAWDNPDIPFRILGLIGIDNPMRHASAFQYPLRCGEVVKSCDEFNRRVLLIGTNFGPIAVYDRSSNQGQLGSFGINLPNSVLVNAVINQHQDVSAADMLRIVGAVGILVDNIGFTIEACVRECNYY